MENRQSNPPKKGAHLLEHRWPKGKSGNPNGRPKKLATKLKKYGYKHAQVVETMENMLGMTLDELKAFYEAEDSSALEKAVASAIKKAITSGRIDALEPILSRAYGSPKQTVENQHTGKDGKPIEIKRTVVFKKYDK